MPSWLFPTLTVALVLGGDHPPCRYEVFGTCHKCTVGVNVSVGVARADQYCDDDEPPPAVTLDGVPLPNGALAAIVREPGVHELGVFAPTTGDRVAVEFAVLDFPRGWDEWGLPPWLAGTAADAPPLPPWPAGAPRAAAVEQLPDALNIVVLDAPGHRVRAGALTT